MESEMKSKVSVPTCPVSEIFNALELWLYTPNNVITGFYCIMDREILCLSLKYLQLSLKWRCIFYWRYFVFVLHSSKYLDVVFT